MASKNSPPQNSISTKILTLTSVFLASCNSSSFDLHELAVFRLGFLCAGVNSLNVKALDDGKIDSFLQFVTSWLLFSETIPHDFLDSLWLHFRSFSFW